MRDHIAHPYMANSVPAIQQEMLDAIGVDSIETLFSQIPLDHRTQRPIDLPPALTEVQLRRHVLDILAKNKTVEDNLNFLGAGVWQHHVPAACDEVVRRNEWPTSVFGEPSSDHGRNQACSSSAASLANCWSSTWLRCRCVAGVWLPAMHSGWPRA